MTRLPTVRTFDRVQFVRTAGPDTVVLKFDLAPGVLVERELLLDDYQAPGGKEEFHLAHAAELRLRECLELIPDDRFCVEVVGTGPGDLWVGRLFFKAPSHDHLDVATCLIQEGWGVPGNQERPDFSGFGAYALGSKAEGCCGHGPYQEG